MELITKLVEKWIGVNHPFLIHKNGALNFSDITSNSNINLDKIKSGDVVALIGDFDPHSIATLLRLIDKNVILVPLTKDTRSQHDYFFETAFVNVIIEGSDIQLIKNTKGHKLIEQIKKKIMQVLFYFLLELQVAQKQSYMTLQCF